MEIKQSITILNIPSTTLNILDSNKIKTLDELSNKTKSDLKSLNLNQQEIKKVAIELQLQGLNLKNNL